MAALGGLAGIASALSAVGTVISTIGAISAASSEKAIAEHNAKLLEKKADAERATASYEAAQQRKETDLVLSQQRAGAAASGGGYSTAPGVITLAADTDAYGGFLADLYIAQGENSARGYEDQAAATRFAGKARAQNSILSAVGKGIGGLASFGVRSTGTSIPLRYG